MMRNILSVVAGVAVAFAVMMGFEFANSRLYPFPPGMDVFDAAQVRAFAASMPLSALVLVALGWTIGSFAGGYLTTRIAGAATARLALITGAVLTVGGMLNAWMIQNPWWFHFGGLPVFLIFAYLGFRVARARA